MRDLLIFLALAVVCSACGVKGDPLPPETSNATSMTTTTSTSTTTTTTLRKRKGHR